MIGGFCPDSTDSIHNSTDNKNERAQDRQSARVAGSSIIDKGRGWEAPSVLTVESRDCLEYGKVESCYHGKGSGR